MTAPSARMSSSGAPRTDAADDTAIHDLGYRRYDGPRVGATGAWRALYWQGLRTMFGIGRSAKAKVVPVFVILVSMMPAVAMVLAFSLSKGAQPIRYGAMIGGQLILFVLFIAAQAPELLSRDQQHRVLPLLLTREVSRTSYASARLLAMFTALLVAALAPLLFAYIGEIGTAIDPVAAFGSMGSRIGPILAIATLTAIMMSGIASALVVWTPRRAYATAAIIGAFLVAAAIATGLDDLAGVSMRTAEMLDPIRALRTLALVLFGETNRGMELNPPAAVGFYVALEVGLGVAGALIMHWRLRRVVV